MARGDGEGAAAAAGRPAVEGDDRAARLVIQFRRLVLSPGGAPSGYGSLLNRVIGSIICSEGLQPVYAHRALIRNHG